MNERQEQTADVLGKLTVLGTIVLPMNIICGMWGMNVKVPGQDIENLNWFWSSEYIHTVPQSTFPFPFAISFDLSYLGDLRDDQFLICNNSSHGWFDIFRPCVVPDRQASL